MADVLDDLKYTALRGMGYVGTINEMELQFYSALVAGGTIPGSVGTSGNQTIGGVKTFSSSPVVPTPTTATQAANKSYVDAQANPAPASRTGAVTLTAAQFGTQLADATTASFAITLPTAASATGRVFTIKKVDVSANTVTIQANGAELIDGVNTKVLTAQWQSLMIQSNGTAWFII